MQVVLSVLRLLGRQIGLTNPLGRKNVGLLGEILTCASIAAMGGTRGRVSKSRVSTQLTTFRSLVISILSGHGLILPYVRPRNVSSFIRGLPLRITVS